MPGHERTRRILWSWLGARASEQMDGKMGSFYEFGTLADTFRLDVKKRRLTHNGKEIIVTPKVLDVLLLLLQNSGNVLEKGRLMKALWPESFVEEGNLSQNIFVLRKILGDDGNSNRFIQTIPRRGYKFLAQVRRMDVASDENTPGRDNEYSDHNCALDYCSQHSFCRSPQIFKPDFRLFFGGDSDTDELIGRLARFPVLVIIGNSGSGKSSLIRAGLIPALRQGRFRWEGRPICSWRVALFRPASSPFDYLAEILPGALAPELALEDQTEFIEACRNKLPAGGNSLRNAISTLVQATAPEGQPRVLLVVDQFEEIFTLTQNDEVRKRYFDALFRASCVDSAVPVHLVLVLCSDFYSNCLGYKTLSRCLETNVYNMQCMTTGQQTRQLAQSS
jgi:DNA-binding winged helix-turn-helix (wHTH) protein/energy-coupling factor transporter ATP-binding protein EcfA2